MTEKEKAIQLATRFYKESMNFNNSVTVRWEVAKNCALIAVDEILEITKEPNFPMGPPLEDLYYYDCYWLDVKREIERM